MITMTTYLTGNIRNRAGRDFLQFDYLRNMFFYLESPTCPPGTSIVLNDVSAVAVAVDVLR
jgi:hypothetical protein